MALVRAWPDGRTDPGWGLRRPDEPETKGFMWKYTHGAFNDVPISWGFVQERWNFAFVMRSLKVLCIDIDGKNGGHQTIGQLGNLPITLAETSKSGDGYHLFYSTSEDVWDPDRGFAQYSDRIGLVQGVDLRAVGCVFHHQPQRWNDQPIAELPDLLKQRLTNHAQRASAQTDEIIKLVEGGDMSALAIKQDAILEGLMKDIPAGRRNTTLYAIGTQMKLAQVPNWEDLLLTRASQLGLDQLEATKIVLNVRKYGGN